MNTEELEKTIEDALISGFPGSKIKFTITGSSWHIERLPGSKERFDDQYPNMTEEEADAQLIEDVAAIVHKFLPRTQLVSYERYGKKHFRDKEDYIV